MRSMFLAALALLAAGVFERIDTAMSAPGLAIALAISVTGSAVPLIQIPPG